MMKKILVNVFGIEWILPIIAISYIDISVAMLCIMFICPVLVMIFFIVNFVIIKFRQKVVLQKIFGILRIISILSAIGLSIFFINYGIKQYSPNEIFKSIIVNPIPESVKNIERGGRLYAMGSSSFYMTFDISPGDFESIINSQRFSKFLKNDVNKITGRKPELYKKTLDDAKKYMGNVSEIYIFEHDNSVYRFDALTVNKEHTKVYYRAK